MTIERRWLTIQEGAEYLGVHPKSLYRACRRKQIPSSKSRGIGVRIDKLELDLLLERRGVRPEEHEGALKGKASGHYKNGDA